MSLLYYEQAFAKLKLNTKAGGEKSPHKVAMLLAVIDLIEQGHYATNRILFDQKLKTCFSLHFGYLKNTNDQNNPHLPFFHLRSSGFWHHHLNPGKSEAYKQLSTASSTKVIEEHIAYAYLDDELFELLGNHAVRELLKSSLQQSLTQQMRTDLLDVGKGWNWLECEVTVRDYFDMLEKELSGTPYSKAEHRRALLPKLNNRPEGSIEFKHQNITAVLLELGLPYIKGYKPAKNYQKQLYNVVLAYVAGRPQDFDRVLKTADKPVVINSDPIDWASVYDPKLPELIPSIKEPQRQYIARKVNYTQREQNNRNLGTQGEAFVLEFEKQRMIKANREDLVKEVEWSSRDRGDGLGFDIRSFDPQKDQELFIEVKTTSSGKYQPFYITDNELAFSKEQSDQYSLYRVYDFQGGARLFELPGAIDQHVQLSPKNFQAWFRQ